MHAYILFHQMLETLCCKSNVNLKQLEVVNQCFANLRDDFSFLSSYWYQRRGCTLSCTLTYQMHTSRRTSRKTKREKCLGLQQFCFSNIFIKLYGTNYFCSSTTDEKLSSKHLFDVFVLLKPYNKDFSSCFPAVLCSNCFTDFIQN